MTINLNNIITLKKEHPSKTKEWKVIRVGMIYKLQSTTNKEIILELTKDKLEKSIKNIREEK